MGIFVLYTMFTTYAAPLASLGIPCPFFFVPAILPFTCHLPPFPSTPNERRLTFRIVLQDEAQITGVALTAWITIRSVPTLFVAAQ